MKKLMAGAGTIFVVLLGLYFGAVREVIAMPAPDAPDTYEQLALQATVRIVMYTPVDETGTRFAVAQGLGTRVRYGQQHILVTHDHWGEALNSAAFVQFWNAAGDFMFEMDGGEFRNRVLYRDSGTMILNAPAGLPGMVELGNPDVVQVGDQVVVMHHELDEATDQVRVVTRAATIVAADTFRGNGSYDLRTTTGEVVVHGDSGGGVFHEGNLVGNMWATMVDVNWQVWTWDSLADMRAITNESIGAANPLADEAPQASELAARQHLNETLLGD